MTQFVSPPTPSDNAGWLKYVLMWDWHRIGMDGFPGWEIDAETRSPYSVFIAIVHKRDKSSRDMATKWDDIAEGRFYYRDWTDSGTPGIAKGERYWSCFWFQTKGERDRFVRKFRVVAVTPPDR